MAALRVFLSHNSADRVAVNRLARVLIAEGIPVWLDVSELHPGDWLEPKIHDAIGASAVVLACIGANGKGRWHDAELRMARDCGVDILDVCLPGWTPKHDRLSGTRVGFNLHTDWSHGIQVLVATLSKRVELATAATTGPFGGSPYPGIDASFGPDDAEWFFGREDETAKVIHQLQQHRWVWLIGNSGSGKSSLARAGVMGSWARSAGTAGHSAAFEPSRRATEDLAAAVNRICRTAGKALVDPLAAAAHPARLSVDLRERFGGDNAASRLLVVIDQAEQIFPYRAGLGRAQENDAEDEALTVDSKGLRGTCAGMLATLWDLASDRESKAQVHVLVVLRADWLHRALSEPQLVPIFGRSETQITLAAMDAAHLYDAIALPARAVGGGVDPRVLDQLIREVRDNQQGLPLLQLVLKDAWSRAATTEARQITYATLHDGPPQDGPVLGIWIERMIATLEESFGLQISDAHLDTLIPALVELDDRDAPRRRWMSGEVIDGRPDEVALFKAVSLLTKARVMVARGTDQPDRGGSTWPEYQFAHDAVLTGWPKLASSIDRHTENLRLIARLHMLSREPALLNEEQLSRYHALSTTSWIDPRLREYLAWAAQQLADRKQLEAAAETAAENARSIIESDRRRVVVEAAQRQRQQEFQDEQSLVHAQRDWEKNLGGGSFLLRGIVILVLGLIYALLKR